MVFRSSINSLIPATARRKVREARVLRSWQLGGWSVPAPQKVKMNVLRRFSFTGMTWIETGTWIGDTTKELAGMASHVHSIEPQLEYVNSAKKRFRNLNNVSLHHGTSEQLFDEVLKNCIGDVAFWLDGHFSAGGTYAGEVHTPILSELRAIKENLDRLNKVSIFIDDFRCFDPSKTEFSDYPERKVLVDWAVENGLVWTVEHDIFVATKGANF